MGDPSHWTTSPPTADTTPANVDQASNPTCPPIDEALPSPEGSIRSITSKMVLLPLNGDLMSPNDPSSATTLERVCCDEWVREWMDVGPVDASGTDTSEAIVSNRGTANLTSEVVQLLQHCLGRITEVSLSSRHLHKCVVTGVCSASSRFRWSWDPAEPSLPPHSVRISLA